MSPDTRPRIVNELVGQFVAGEGRCPTGWQEVLEKKYAHPHAEARDFWNEPLQITCAMDGDVAAVTVTSRGPDRRLGTADDIVIGDQAAFDRPYED